MASSIVPSIYDPSLADEKRFAATEATFEMARRLAREEGLFVSASSRAALAAALAMAEELERGVVVTVFSDGGARSLSEGPFAETTDD